MVRILGAGIAIAVALVAVALYVLAAHLRISLSDLEANMTVGTGMGAKLSCSSHFITGLEPAQIEADLSSYTPATRTLSIDIDEAQRAVRVDLFGLAATGARFRDGLGCTLEIGDTALLDTIVRPDLPGTAGPWPAGEGANPLQPTVQNAVVAMMARDNAAGLQTRALAVAHGGRLVAETYADGFAHTTPLLGWSMAKSLTSIMFGHLEMRGLVAVDESRLFDEWLDDDRRRITVENLLQMSSGLDFEEVYAPGSDATRMLFTVHSASGTALVSALKHAPGTHFYYSSGTTNLLTRLLNERLGGTQASVDFLAQEIFEPLGVRSGVMELDPSGIFVGSSYVYATPRDWARVGQLMLNGGELNGARLVTEAWVRRATTPNPSENDPRYGYQFWLNGGGDVLRWPQLPVDAYIMSGDRGQTVMIVPSRDAVLVRLGWTSGRYPMAQNFAELLDLLDLKE